MKKKIVVSILLILVVLVGIITLNYETEGKVLKDEKRVISRTSSISMMLETEVDSGIYEISTDTSWPTSGYSFNDSLSKCENGSSITWDSSTSTVLVTGNITDKCYIYFDAKEPSYTISEILATKKISTRSNFSTAFTDDTTGIVYETSDNDGYTYYWAGDATDNYVYFAGFYWRIVRINGDGTLRLIYDGSKQAYENGVSDEDRAIGTSAYNEYSGDDNAYYVGYTYTVGQQRPSTKNSGTDSTIKTYIEAWYSDNLEGTEYEEYIYQSGKFCNDREVNNSGSWRTYDVYYAAYGRLYTNKSPSLECTNDLDEYTLNIGLITADEIAYAGGVYSVSNQYFYLYIGYNFFTMTPSYNFDGTATHVFYHGVSNSLNDLQHIDYSLYVKPVINLNSDILLTGSGTIDSPYEVVMS